MAITGVIQSIIPVAGADKTRMSGFSPSPRSPAASGRWCHPMMAAGLYLVGVTAT
jgi:hypothetical protein